MTSERDSLRESLDGLNSSLDELSALLTSDEIVIFFYALLITAALFPFYFHFIRKYRQKANKNSRAAVAKRDGLCVTAKWVGTKLCRSLSNNPRRRSISYLVGIYAYTVGGKTYKQNYVLEDGRDPEYEKLMYYMPHSPKKAYSESDINAQDNKQNGFILTLGIPIVWFWVMFFLLDAIVLDGQITREAMGNAK
jgi:hypothetical protein